MNLSVFIVFILASLAAPLLGESSTMPPVSRHDAFSIIGIEIRTNNRRELSGDGLIGQQWQKFFHDGVLEKIPNKADTTIYAVYSDYSSDRNGEYSFTLGARVAEGTQVPSGLVLKRLPAGDYALVSSEPGQMEKVVPAAWRRVWQLEDQHALGGTRAYKADYERYDERAHNPQNAQVDLYIGLK